MPSSLPLYSYVKLRFLRRVRRFLRSKSSRKRFRTPSDPSEFSSPKVRETEESVVRKYDPPAVLQRTVKSLHFGDGEEKETAAKEIERLIKESAEIRKLMVDLGVIPALVAMADSDHLAVRALIQLANDSFVYEIRKLMVDLGVIPALVAMADSDHLAVRALIQLANDSLVNKTQMVEEGILSKLPNNAQLVTMNSTSHEFAELLFSLSFLANTQLFLASTEPVISYTLTILNSESNPNPNPNPSPSPKTKTFCLATLFNISTILENTETLISNGAIPTLLKFSSVKEYSEKALPTLANLAVTSKGKQGLETNSTFPEILIDILTWDSNPKCQELSAYIVMIVAHQSWAQRERLAKSRIVPALVELALLGTPLAQKRALKLLQWFKDERQARVGPHSGPQAGRVVVGSGFNEKEIEKGKRMMRSLVKQSLYKNMEMITRRANGGECSSPIIWRTLVSSTSSKSLPF